MLLWGVSVGRDLKLNGLYLSKTGIFVREILKFEKLDWSSDEHVAYMQYSYPSGANMGDGLCSRTHLRRWAERELSEAETEAIRPRLDRHGTNRRCVFCDRRGEVAVDEYTVTMRDKFPVSPGHTLVIIRRHVASFSDTTLGEQLALLRAVAAARRQLDAEFHPDGYNIGINDGVAAGQTVMHVHIHVIPRYAGDAEDPRGGVRHCVPGKGYYDPTAGR